MWHIAKRELYDTLNSLRFAFATALLFLLMLMNAVLHIHEHPVRLQQYHDATTASLSGLKSQKDLFSLARGGPGALYKKPSPLYFCAEGGDRFFSDFVQGMSTVQITNDLLGFWVLYYPPAFPNSSNIRPETLKVDWFFVIGYVLSLIAILFTFDAISGERERGTLRLMLATSVPRHAVLSGKFLGALISISVPFTLAILMNLLVIAMSRDVHLETDAWIRLCLIFVIAILYLCLFLALGLLVSSCVRSSAVSLVILLLTWCTFVVFIPSTFASIASGFSSPMTYDEFFKRREQNQKELRDAYRGRLSEVGGFPEKKMQLESEFVSKGTAQEGRLFEEHLGQQLSQVRLARAFTRISPVAIVQYLLEAFSGTGFQRHLHFVENVQRYAREYRAFVTDLDRSDPDSAHLFGVREGLSQKPVRPEAIPTFQDTLRLSRDFNAAAIDLFLLILFFVVLMLGAYLRFVCVDV